MVLGHIAKGEGQRWSERVGGGAIECLLLIRITANKWNLFPLK